VKFIGYSKSFPKGKPFSVSIPLYDPDHPVYSFLDYSAYGDLGEAKNLLHSETAMREFMIRKKELISQQLVERIKIICKLYNITKIGSLSISLEMFRTRDTCSVCDLVLN
jgi:hypothetical protein